MKHLSSVDKACELNYPSKFEYGRCVGLLTNALEVSGYDKASNPVSQEIISASCHRTCKKKDGSVGDKCFLDCVIAGNIAFSAGEPIKEGYTSSSSSSGCVTILVSLVLLSLLVWLIVSMGKKR